LNCADGKRCDDSSDKLVLLCKGAAVDTAGCGGDWIILIRYPAFPQAAF
jgi:hypothetical protein